MFESKVVSFECAQKLTTFSSGHLLITQLVQHLSDQVVEMPMKGVSRDPFDQPSCQAAAVDHQIILKEGLASESQTS